MSVNFQRFLIQLWRWLKSLFEKPKPPEPLWIKVRICLDSELLANEYCPDGRTEFKEFIEGQGPTAFCAIHKPPIKVKLFVCAGTDVLPNEWCPIIVEREYIQGEEPTAICAVHKRPKPKRTHMPVSLELYAAFLKFFIDNNPDFWSDTFRRIHDEHIERVAFFPYAIEDNGLYNHIIPWMKVGDRFDLSRHDESYWQKFSLFADIAADAGVLLVPVLYPGFYGEAPFRHNINGISSEFSIEARAYQVIYMRRLLTILNNAYRDTCWGDALWARLSNEVSHGGDHALGFRIAYQHSYWYEAIKDLIPLDRIINDTTYSDFVIGDLSEEHEAFGVTIGKDEYDRLTWIEQHGINPWRLDEPIEEGRTDTLWELMNGGCGWTKFVLSTDGNDRGSGVQVPGTSFKGLSQDELGQLCWRAWNPSNSSQFIVAELPMEVFIRNSDGILEEDYSRLDYERLKIMNQVWREIHGN